VKKRRTHCNASNEIKVEAKPELPPEMIELMHKALTEIHEVLPSISIPPKELFHPVGDFYSANFPTLIQEDAGIKGENGRRLLYYKVSNAVSDLISDFLNFRATLQTQKIFKNEDVTVWRQCMYALIQTKDPNMAGKLENPITLDKNTEIWVVDINYLPILVVKRDFIPLHLRDLMATLLFKEWQSQKQTRSKADISREKKTSSLHIEYMVLFVILYYTN